MDTIRIAAVQADHLAEELSTQKTERDHALGQIRPLEDWELALAGGGDNNPEWQ